jgi:hypothetical protein
MKKNLDLMKSLPSIKKLIATYISIKPDPKGKHSIQCIPHMNNISSENKISFISYNKNYEILNHLSSLYINVHILSKSILQYTYVCKGNNPYNV